MSQLKRKAEEDINQDKLEKKSAPPSFKRPLFLEIAHDDGVELIQMRIKFRDAKTPGCVDVPKDWVFAGEVFPFLYEAIGHVIPSRNVCGIIAGYCSSHENTGQQAWIHSCYKLGKERHGYPPDVITIYDTFDEKAACRIVTPNNICRGECKCKVLSCRSSLYIGRDFASIWCYDAKIVAISCYRCPHIVYSCEYVVPCLPYL
jgi:hypothetical protein